MDAILAVYLSGAVLIVVWQSILLIQKASHLDWKSNKKDLLWDVVISAIFWPIMIFTKPRDLISVRSNPPDDLVVSHERRMGELVQIAESPPPCGCQVMYQHDCWGEESEVLFNAADIESYFKGKELPLFHNEECQALISFIKSRRDDWPRIESIPDSINFKKVAFELMKAGYGDVRCDVCDQLYSVNGLDRSKPPVHGGWNAETYSCPEGHELLKHDYMHVMLPSR